MASSDTFIYNTYREMTGQDLDPAMLDYFRRYSDQDLKGAISNLNQDQVGSYLEERKDRLAQEAVIEMHNKGIKNVEDYVKNNPLAFDDAWYSKTTKLMQEQVDIDPYYKEKLSNYLTDWDNKKTRAQEDETTILKEIDRQQNYYVKEDTAAFQTARMNALEGQTETGEVGSGAGMRKINMGDISHTNALNNYLGDMNAKKQQAQTTTDRYLTDLGIEKQRFSTDLEREKVKNVNALVNWKGNQEVNAYNAGLAKVKGEAVPGFMGYLG